MSAEGVLGALHDLPWPPGHDSDGLAPLCCQHLHRDEMGQLQAKFESQTRLIDGAMCMFRVRAEPEQYIVQDVDGLIVKVQAECCVCNQTVTLQQAGAPQSVQKMNRMRVGELALTNVIVQSDGGQPFEVMQLRTVTSDEMMHEKLHKFQASEYQEFATGSVEIDITTTPSKDVQHMFANTVCNNTFEDSTHGIHCGPQAKCSALRHSVESIVIDPDSRNIRHAVDRLVLDTALCGRSIHWSTVQKGLSLALNVVHKWCGHR